MKFVRIIALLTLKASAMLGAMGAMGAGKAMGGGKAGAETDNEPKNQFPEQKIDTATGVFQKYARKDLLDSIESTLIHLDEKLTSIETRFQTKLKAVENLAAKEVRKVLEGIRSETDKLGLL